jgi:hypothetical protein
MRRNRPSGNGSIDRELTTLVAAIEAAGDAQVIVAEIKRLETRKAELDRVLNRPVIDRKELRKALDAKMAEWKRLLRSRPTHGQTVLRTLLGKG